MPPPRAVAADDECAVKAAPKQSAEELVAAIESFVAAHPGAAVLEDGKVVFELGCAQQSVRAEHNRCVLQLWSPERNLVRTIVAAERRGGSLRLSTQRFGHGQTKLLELRAEAQPRTPARREPERRQYLRLLERVLAREFPEWRAEGFRAAMDLERSFGPAYARGSLVRGNEAWAVIGVSASESQAIIDGVLTLGVLWLHHCRAEGDGRRLYKGLRVVAPRGTAMLTLARLAWMNPAAARWELYELDESTEELAERDPADQGNLRTRLLHAPDEDAARERFADAMERVMRLVPKGEEHRVEQRLRSTAELGFVLHGLEFARACLSPAPGSFTQAVEIAVGHGSSQTVLTAANEGEIREQVAELFERRDARAVRSGPRRRSVAPGRSIGPLTGRPAHARLAVEADGSGLSRFELRQRAMTAQGDPLFRAAPERWLESVLRENLAPLTRCLGPAPAVAGAEGLGRFANDPEPDTRGNCAEPEEWSSSRNGYRRRSAADRIIPRFDPRFVYTQVPAIAGASDRGMLDLLGMTADGRLAVIELKAADDLQMALQGLDYWIRVRHHQMRPAESSSGPSMGQNELQKHGYFGEVELSPLPPRLYLIAPALHIHPATETVLRYLSPKVEWMLLAIDERWRQEVRVVWRRSGGRAG